MKCQTIQTVGGSMIVGCGSEPCRCDEIDQMMAKAFGRERNTDDAQPSPEEISAEERLRRRRALMLDYDRKLKEWLS